MAKIYTKTGDDGTTGLYGGGRISKSHLRIQAIGDVDELNAQIGWAGTMAMDERIKRRLQWIQRDLFSIGADLAATGSREVDRIGSSAIKELERCIDEADYQLPPLKQFVLPGGSAPAATLHLARAVCRRAERSVVALGVLHPLEQPNPNIAVYLNRLSDLLFIWARLANVVASVEEIVW